MNPPLPVPSIGGFEREPRIHWANYIAGIYRRAKAVDPTDPRINNIKLLIQRLELGDVVLPQIQPGGMHHR